MSTTDTAMLDAALEYAGRGVPVFPVWGVAGGRCACGKHPCGEGNRTAGKHPLAALVPNGVLNATADLALVRAWWTRYATANIGTATVWATVLDVDPRHGGDVALDALERRHGPLPDTAEVITGGGGRHIYFRPVAELAPSSGKVGSGLDIKTGPGAYVLLPPSSHVSGGVYCDELMRPLFDTPLAPMPAWLVALAMSTPNGGPEAAPYRSPDEWARLLTGAPEGQRRGAALKIAGHYLGQGIAAAEVVTILLGYAGRCVPPFPEREARALVRDLARRHRTQTAQLASAAVLPGDGRAAIVVRASEVVPEALSWLWPGRLAVGALTNVVGLPDQGKSLIYTDLAARMSTGSPMPPAPYRPGAAPTHRVLILTHEDSPATIVVPRLAKAGADLTRIDLLQMVRDTDGHLSIVTLSDDLDVLEIVLTTDRYGLLIVDGIAGYLGADAKTHNDADVRRVLMPFAALLDRMKVAGLSVMHPPKAVANLAYFAGGSVAFSAIPRVTLGVAADPDDDRPTPRRFLGKLKGNLYGRVPSLAFQIKSESDAGVPWLEWELGEVAVDLATVFDPPREAPEERGPRRACEEWLRAFLAEGPRHSIDVEKAAQAAGFKARTLRRARERITDSVKAGTDRWSWILRPEAVR